MAVLPVKALPLVRSENAEQLVTQAVRPGNHHVRQLLFDFLDADARPFAFGGPHDDVHARKCGIRNLYRRIDRDAAESFRQEFLDAAPDGGRVFLARYVHEAGEKSTERVAAQEKFDAAAILQVENPERGSGQVVHVALEQFLARIGLDDVEQRLAAVPGLGYTRPLVDLLDLVTNERNVSWTFAVGGRGEQADETVLADGIALFVVDLDADVVEECRAMHGGARIGLGQDQPVTRARQPAHFLGQFDAFRRPRLATQQSEPGALDRFEEDAFAALLELVLAIAEERKVIVDHPVDQRLAFALQQRVHALRAVLEQFARFVHALAHLAPVTNCGADIRQDFKDLLAECFDDLGIGFTIDRKANERFAIRIVVVAIDDAGQITLVVAFDRDDRVNRDVYRLAMPDNCGRHRVDEKRHVVIDHLDEGVCRRIAVFLLVGVEDAE